MMGPDPPRATLLNIYILSNESIPPVVHKEVGLYRIRTQNQNIIEDRLQAHDDKDPSYAVEWESKAIEDA